MLTTGERMELRRAALATARRHGAGAHAGRCARLALEQLEDGLDAVPPGRRMAWITRTAEQHARSGRWSVFDGELVSGRRSDDPDWLVQVLQPLADRDREVLQLTYGEGLTAIEIGRLIGCPVDIVVGIRHQARLSVGARTAA